MARRIASNTTVLTPAEAARLFRPNGALEKHLVGAIEAAAVDAALATKRVLEKASPKDTGIYAGSWDIKWHSEGKARHLDLENDAPYAGVIELGTRPYWPPLQPLIDWAERKAGDIAQSGAFTLSKNVTYTRGDGSTGYRGRASLTDDDRATVERFARGVQAKIARKGLMPRYVMRKRIPFLRMALKRSFEEFLGREPAPIPGHGYTVRGRRM